MRGATCPLSPPEGGHIRLAGCGTRDNRVSCGASIRTGLTPPQLGPNAHPTWKALPVGARRCLGAAKGVVGKLATSVDPALIAQVLAVMQNLLGKEIS